MLFKTPSPYFNSDIFCQPAPKDVSLGVHAFNVPPVSARPKRGSNSPLILPERSEPLPRFRRKDFWNCVCPVAQDCDFSIPLERLRLEKPQTYARPRMLPWKFPNPPLHSAFRPVRSPTLSPTRTASPNASLRSRLRKSPSEPDLGLTPAQTRAKGRVLWNPHFQNLLPRPRRKAIESAGKRLSPISPSASKLRTDTMQRGSSIFGLSI